jgi:hypothetical protein
MHTGEAWTEPGKKTEPEEKIEPILPRRMHGKLALLDLTIGNERKLRAGGNEFSTHSL